MHLALILGLIFIDINFYVILSAVMVFFICDFASSAGYHKMLSHKAFTPKPWVTPLVTAINLCSLVGDPVSWVATHRTNHKFSDTDRDPHTLKNGRWYAYYGWFLDDHSSSSNAFIVKDLAREYKWMKNLRKYNSIIPVTFFGILFALSNFIFISVLLGAILNFHKLCLLNSFGHTFGPDNVPIPVNVSWAARFINPVFLHKNHHDTPGLYDYGSGNINDYSVWLIKKLMATKS
jgi:stearoyl-CoA desaturase (delta-9 desaturase)